MQGIYYVEELYIQYVSRKSVIKNATIGDIKYYFHNSWHAHMPF